MDTSYRAVSASVFTHSKSHQPSNTALLCYSSGTTKYRQWQTLAHTCTEKCCPAPPQHTLGHSLLSLDTPAQRGEMGVWCRGTFTTGFLLREEKVSLPCAYLAKWENNISVITAHTKHKSLIGSNYIAVNIDNNPEFKGLPVRWNSKGFARPKAVPQPRFSFDHSLQVAPVAEAFSAETDTDSHLWGGGWMNFPLQVSPTAHTTHLCTREHKIPQTSELGRHATSLMLINEI